MNEVVHIISGQRLPVVRHDGASALTSQALTGQHAHHGLIPWRSE